MLKKLLYSSALCLFVLATAGFAKADTLTYTLTQDGCSGGCGSGPYGTITLTQDGSNVNVVETLASSSTVAYYFVNTGAGNPLEFNLTDPSATITNVESPTYFSAGGADSASTFGSFTDSITCSGCAPGASKSIADNLTTLSFTVDGVTLSDFIANSDGEYFASDIGEAVYKNDSWSIIATGNVGADCGPTSTPVVPEPSTLLLLGTGLLALAGMMKLKSLA